MVVGGLTTLSAMEKVPVDDDDRPLVSVIPSFFVMVMFVLFSIIFLSPVSQIHRLYSLDLTFMLCSPYYLVCLKLF